MNQRCEYFLQDKLYTLHYNTALHNFSTASIKAHLKMKTVDVQNTHNLEKKTTYR